MSKKNKISMPQSGGGLVRYFDEYKSKFEIKPAYVIVLIVVAIILVAILHKLQPWM
ncbi:MAG: preprotein translocase subunit Sec61beta [Nanoarchaeota archaeon]|nr:preprotein translocase subunit Sec61beta [Nanoarchaeota archaeon]